MPSESLFTPVEPQANLNLATYSAMVRPGFRPIRVWAAMARQQGIVVHTATIVRILRTTFVSMRRFGGTVPASSLWVNSEGELQIVDSEEGVGFTNPAWCMEGLALMMCELLAGVPLPNDVSSQFALNMAKAGAETGGGWDATLGFVLQRMLGDVATYGSAEEALLELDEFFLATPRTSLAHYDETRLVTLFSKRPRPDAWKGSWLFPALMGAVSTGLLFTVAGWAFWLGSRHNAPVASMPVAVQPTPTSITPQTTVTLDPSVLAALKLIGAPLPMKPASIKTTTTAPAPLPPPRPAQTVAEEGPVFVDEPIRIGKAANEDPFKVKSGDFVAKRR